MFTYKHGTNQKKGTVTLTIPRPWTRAERDNNDGNVEDGEVFVIGGNSWSVTSGSGGWLVKVNYTDDPPGYEDAVITYSKVTVPNRAGKYEFGISSTTHRRRTRFHGGSALQRTMPFWTMTLTVTRMHPIRALIVIAPTRPTAEASPSPYTIMVIRMTELMSTRTDLLRLWVHIRILPIKRITMWTMRTMEPSTVGAKHGTHPDGMSGHKHTDSGTAVQDHSHAGLSVDKQGHEHDANGDVRADADAIHTWAYRGWCQYRYRADS